MLDFDLAVLYEVETKRLKEAVRRNSKRFPSDFMFELTIDEYAGLRTQFASSKARGGIRYMPFAFTEQGVAMLSSVLNSEKAIEMNIIIVRAFIALRQFALQYKDLADQVMEIRQTVENHSEQLAKIYLAINTLLTEREKLKTWAERERIGFSR